MSESPFFSIVVPTLNSEKVVANAIESILRQTFSSFEVLIMDSCSQDSTILIAEGFGDDRIRIFREKDKGVYDAMNKSINHVKGDWVLFLGSDDRLADSNVLFDVAHFLKENCCDVLYGNVSVVGDTPWAKHGNLYDGEFDLRKLIRKNICHQSMFYRKVLIDKVGFYNIDYSLSADWDFNLRCWSKGKCTYINRIISFFHAGGESTRVLLDVSLNKAFISNLFQYFDIDAFDPLLSGTDFLHKDSVIKLQKRQNILRFWLSRFNSSLSSLKRYLFRATKLRFSKTDNG